jgi:hypothetical protein
LIHQSSSFVERRSADPDSITRFDFRRASFRSGHLTTSCLSLIDSSRHGSEGTPSG